MLEQNNRPSVPQLEAGTTVVALTQVLKRLSTKISTQVKLMWTILKRLELPQRRSLRTRRTSWTRLDLMTLSKTELLLWSQTRTPKSLFLKKMKLILRMLNLMPRWMMRSIVSSTKSSMTASIRENMMMMKKKATAKTSTNKKGHPHLTI